MKYTALVYRTFFFAWLLAMDGSVLDIWASFASCAHAAETIVARNSHSLPPPQVSRIESRLLADARDGELRQFDLIEAAIIASGVTDDAERARWLRVRDARYAAMDLPAIAHLPTEHRPAAVLGALHREILAGKFQASATLLPATLATGDFNCVTATVLYFDLCSRAGVPVAIVAQSGHVNCRLLGPPANEVEPTRRDWFTREWNETRLPEARSTEARQVISPVELLGRIYYNRALAELEKREFSTAISLLQVSIELDEADRDAQENLRAALNNWALALCEQGQYAAAVERIEMGLKLDSHYPMLLTNELHVHQQWALHLCRQGDFAGAIRVLEAGSRRQPEAPLFVTGKKSVFEMWVKACAAKGDTAAAAQVLRQAQAMLGPQSRVTLEAKPVMRVSPDQGRRSLSGEATHGQ